MRDTGLRWLGTVAVGVATIGFTGLAAPAQAMVVAGDQTCVGVDAQGHNDAARGGYGPDTRAVSSAEQRAIAQRTQRLLRAQPEKQAAAAEVTVPVYVHVMAAKNEAGDWTTRVPHLREYGPAEMVVDDPAGVSQHGQGYDLEEGILDSWEMDSPVSRPIPVRAAEL